MSTSPRTGSATLIAMLGATAVVVVWRAAALMLYASQAESSLTIKTPLAAVGLTFLVCGLLVFLKAPGEASLLFAAFCICSGLHWGGPLELASGFLRTGLILFYLLVSSVLGTTLLLHFALVFPTRSRVVDRRVPIALLYAPTVLATILAAVFLVAPAESGLRDASQQGFLLLHMIVSNLFAVVALGLFIAHLSRSGSDTTRRQCLGLMVAGMLTAWLPYLVASTAGVENTDPWNLTVVALPLSFAFALSRIRTVVVQ